jgi:hypothetical protein
MSHFDTIGRDLADALDQFVLQRGADDQHQLWGVLGHGLKGQ